MAEKTFSYGNVFRFKGSEAAYLLSIVDSGSKVSLITLPSKYSPGGVRWNDPVKVTSIDKITEQEMRQVLGSHGQSYSLENLEQLDVWPNPTKVTPCVEPAPDAVSIPVGNLFADAKGRLYFRAMDTVVVVKGDRGYCESGPYDSVSTGTVYSRPYDSWLGHQQMQTPLKDLGPIKSHGSGGIV